MKQVLLITSGAYVSQELEAEFGRIPPAFLPIGNRRLFVRQREVIGDAADEVLMSLPEDFQIDMVDQDLLDELGIKVVRVPAGLTLGNSIVYVINVTATSQSNLRILHGDTLLFDLPATEQDVVSVASSPPGYHWGIVQGANGTLEFGTSSDESSSAPGTVLTGYFSFSDASALVQAITRSSGDFISGLTAYNASNPLRLISAGEWLDFGHANTYYQSRQRMTTEREFNRLDLTKRLVVKSGTNAKKISAEAAWFEALPSALRLHTPAFLGSRDANGEPAYAVEFLNHSTLTDLFVFGRLPPRRWERIFSACDEFLQACFQFKATSSAADSAQDLYLTKTLTRLEEYARDKGISLTEPCRYNNAWLPSLEQMATLAAEMVPAAEHRYLSLVHGDFCFSNIIYDFRSELVRVIDPRGLDAHGQLSVFGDIRYDIAKLHHSVIGRYDHIIAGYYRLSSRSPLNLTLELPESEHLSSVEHAFRSHRFAGLDLASAAARPITTLLFLSMLPLHRDGPMRQTALLANAMRLFLTLDQPALSNQSERLAS